MKLVSILGPTCSGKSRLALDLCHELASKNLRAVIVSADSRQVYRYLDIGTAKISGSWKLDPDFGSCFVCENIPHFLIDFLDLSQNYSLNNYLQDYSKLFKIWSRANLLIDYIVLCGGTGFYATSAAHELQLKQFKSEYQSEILEYKNFLGSQNLSWLKSQSSEADFNNSDFHNPTRLVNYLLRKKAIEKKWFSAEKLDYPTFTIKYGFLLNPDDLELKLKVKLEERYESGLFEETAALLEQKLLNIDKLEKLGLEYKIQAKYFQKEIDLDQAKELILKANLDYIKRQKTWFKTQMELVKIESLESILEQIDLSP
jgi:tRNA dimethylallyltransferase